MIHSKSVRIGQEELREMGVDISQLPWTLPCDPLPLMWWEHDEWICGMGVVAREDFYGPSRIAQISGAWEKCHDAHNDEYLAFFTSTFSNSSQQSSALIFPELILHWRAGSLVATLAREGSAVSEDEAAKAARDLLAGRVPCVTSRAHEWAHLPYQAPGASLTKHEARAAHLRSVAGALDRIESREDPLEKLVIARSRSAALPGDFSLLQALCGLAKAYPSTQVFSVDGFFGASPETLIRKEERDYSSLVLAGTVARGEDPTFLLKSAKERHEHEYAARSVWEAFERVWGRRMQADSSGYQDADGVLSRDLLQSASIPHDSIQREGPRIVQLPNVAHLASSVSAASDTDVFFTLLEELHPTAAVAGVPRVAAMSAIREIEQEDRGRYAGPVGWVAPRRARVALGIRSAQLYRTEGEFFVEEGAYQRKEDSCQPEGGSHQREGGVLPFFARAWAGGGIVAGSEPEREFEETQRKLEPILTALRASRMQ